MTILLATVTFSAGFVGALAGFTLHSIAAGFAFGSATGACCIVTAVATILVMSRNQPPKPNR